MSLWDKVFGKAERLGESLGETFDEYGNKVRGLGDTRLGESFGETIGEYRQGGNPMLDMFTNPTRTSPGGINPMNQPVNNISDAGNMRNMNQQNIQQEQNQLLQPQPAMQDGTNVAPENSGYQQMLQQMQSQYGQSPEQMEDIMNRISYHETGPQSRMDPSTIQGGGGPGRGLFQFETGEKQGGATAMGYMRQYHNRHNPGQEMPSWMDYDPRQGVDASKLSPEQQKMMFMANTAMSGPRSFEGVNPDNLGDWWQKNHYAGDIDKTDIFGESMGAYDLNNTPTAEEQAFPAY
jgi:hypothetical protein